MNSIPKWSKRKELRLQHAENVCREVRYYTSNFPNFSNMDIHVHLLKWMNLAPKNKYNRAPKLKDLK